MAAELTVLHDGYANDDGVASSLVFGRDGDVLIVVDPGMVRGPQLVLEPLAALGVQPHEVTDVVLSHHHPDHTWHIVLRFGARTLRTGDPRPALPSRRGCRQRRAGARLPPRAAPRLRHNGGGAGTEPFRWPPGRLRGEIVLDDLSRIAGAT